MYELSGFSIVNSTPFLLRSMNNSATNIANLLASSTLWASRPLSVGSPAGCSLDLKGGGVGAPRRCKAAGMGLSRALDIVPQGGPAWAYRMPSLSISWRTARCPVGSAKSNRTTVAWVACLLRSQSMPNASRPTSKSARVRPADPAHNSTALGRTGAVLVPSVLAQGLQDQTRVWNARAHRRDCRDAAENFAAKTASRWAASALPSLGNPVRD